MSDTTYDSKCWDLAKAFLSDFRVAEDERERLTHRFAQHIQQAAEEFIETEGLEEK